MPSGTTPICRFRSSASALKFCPRISISPRRLQQAGEHLDGRRLPPPFGPRKPKNCPEATLKLTSSTAVKSPKRRVSP